MHSAAGREAADPAEDNSSTRSQHWVREWVRRALPEWACSAGGTPKQGRATRATSVAPSTNLLYTCPKLSSHWPSCGRWLCSTHTCQAAGLCQGGGAEPSCCTSSQSCPATCPAVAASSAPHQVLIPASLREQGTDCLAVRSPQTCTAAGPAVAAGSAPHSASSCQPASRRGQRADSSCQEALASLPQSIPGRSA